MRQKIKHSDMSVYDIDINFIINNLIKYFERLKDNGLIDNDKNIYNITSIQFKSLLIDFSNEFIKNTDILKVNNNINNKYDIDKLNYLTDLFISVMAKLNKTINIYNYCVFVGIQNNTFYNLCDPELNPRGFELYQKIYNCMESDYIDLNTDKGGVNAIAVTNHILGWNNENNGNGTISVNYQLQNRPILSITDTKK